MMVSVKVSGLPQNRVSFPQPPLLRVYVVMPDGERRNFEFQKPFRIGRADECEVCLKSDFVSRIHVDVTFENGRWWARDLNSSNGVYSGGKQVTGPVPIDKTALRLGVAGPMIGMECEKPVSALSALPPQAQPPSQPVAPPVPPGPPHPPPKPELQPPPPKKPGSGAMSDTMVAKYIDRYFQEGKSGEPAGEHTMIMRHAFSQVHKKQKRKYWKIMAALGVLIVSIGAYAFYLHLQSLKQRGLAKDLFYSIKTLDVNIAGVEKLVMDSGNQKGIDEAKKYQDQRRELEKNYDKFLSELQVYTKKISPQEKIILRMARVFGECELNMPPGFVDEVNNYIKKWQSSSRLANDLNVANQNGYIPVIASELLAQDLPPQFVYMALQESNFDPFISGPPTRSGIAKGMWQFIPETAVKYGLKVGPLADMRRPDPGDDRHHWNLETKAAARYLKDLYSMDAQASGLLVMACYNWGEDSVLPLVRKMPLNPKDRNFWQLLSLYKEKIPPETYDYVYYIFSAAVIGEDPQLFGFKFDKPLGRLEGK